MAVPQISLKFVKSLMLQGYVRYKADDDGNGMGSIEEELGQTPAALREIFAHPKIKGIRIKVPLFNLIDDIPDGDNEGIDIVDDLDETTVTDMVLIPISGDPLIARLEAAAAVREAIILSAEAEILSTQAAEEAELEFIMENATAEEAELFA